MSKKKDTEAAKVALVYELDPTECPFKEYKDQELTPDFWGLGPAATRAAILLSGKVPKPPSDYIWVDDQTQPLPRSVRQYLHGWVRAEDLAANRWEAEVVVFEENNPGSKMSVIDMQLSHAQVLLRSSFCRKVLCICYILERVEGLPVEHQWENFLCSYIPEGWRPRYHIYSPGIKAGGGPQHRPGLSKNGCYMVRLFYLGAWRCVWVNDQIPVDATDAPLLPFSPLLSRVPPVKGAKTVAMVTDSVVFLWPLLICKALLKLAAPDMNNDDGNDSVEDEPMSEFDIMHSLTGGMQLTFNVPDPDQLWKLLVTEIPVFGWDDDDETVASTIKSKTKKPATKEVVSRDCLVTVLIQDTKTSPPYLLPGITPGHEQSLLVTMARDVPLKKPLPEPEVALWKYYRWVDWARGHGLYEAYDCPRTRFLKVNGLMKLSHAPHLLDVMSTESITYGFREEHGNSNPAPAAKKGGKGDVNRSQTGPKVANSAQATQVKEELREWMKFETLQTLVKATNVLYYPSMFECTTAGSSPPVRILKGVPNRALDIIAPKCAPLYLQIDGPDEICLRISLAALDQHILMNSGIPVTDNVESAYLLLEKIDWFVDKEIPTGMAFVETKGYNSVQINFQPGRHYCRLWVHSPTNWHTTLISEASLLLGSRDVILAAAVHECPWASRFLNNLSTAFTGWIRSDRHNSAILTTDADFFTSYKPDLKWDPEIVGYNQALLHWMFRQALQSLLRKRLPPWDFQSVCAVLRHHLCDPNFGLPPKPYVEISLREIAMADPCDCVKPEVEEMEETEEFLEEEETMEEKPIVDAALMAKLLIVPTKPVVSQICELATEELPCGLLKEEREKVIKKHEAATVIQAYWRGFWARKCLNNRIIFTPETFKNMMDNSFGNLEALSALMNEFFGMYPGAKSAYSVSSALSGVKGLQQYQGTSSVTTKCTWIPYFQSVFYCHAQVKVHLSVQCTLQYSTVMVYNNDTGLEMPQAYNSHITFDFSPNIYGYTVMGHGSLTQRPTHNSEVHWQLTVLSSINGAFHVCDNEYDGCKELQMHGAYKLHIDEIFLPNRRNILGGILISVTKYESISFRAAATSRELDIVATLSTTTPQGETVELAHCSGKGEIYWPYIRLCAGPVPEITLDTTPALSARSLPKAVRLTKTGTTKNKSKVKIASAIESKQYSIEVTAPEGWPLNLEQWKRVDEVRNAVELAKVEPIKKPPKPPLTKEKEKPPASPTLHTPQLDDAFIELECSIAIGGGAIARRDDLRDQEFAAARKLWDANELGRNLRGAQIRKDFRAEFLEALPIPSAESLDLEDEEMDLEGYGEEDSEYQKKVQQGPTPETKSEMMEMTAETEEEALYLSMPDQLRDKFVPLYFLPFCMKEKNEYETALLSSDMAEAAKQDRHARIEAALERMNELQNFNEEFVLMRQKRRCQLLETVFVDSQWRQELTDVLEARDDSIATETLNRTLSANKKKLDSKKK